MHKSSSEVNFKAYRKEVGVERKNGEVLTMQVLLWCTCGRGMCIWFDVYRRFSLQCHDQHPPALLENPESETRWYFKYFLAKGRPRIHMHIN